MTTVTIQIKIEVDSRYLNRILGNIQGLGNTGTILEVKMLAKDWDLEYFNTKPTLEEIEKEENLSDKEIQKLVFKSALDVIDTFIYKNFSIIYYFNWRDRVKKLDEKMEELLLCII